jgi:putative proteasome-type protease
MPIDLVCYERDSLAIRRQRRFQDGDTYFTTLSAGWSAGVRQAFRDLPDLEWW